MNNMLLDIFSRRSLREAPTLPFFLTNSNILSTLGAGILGSNHITFALALKKMGKGNSIVQLDVERY